VVNADDFGLSPAVSRGILTAHRGGIVTSTSLLGNATDLSAAAAMLAQAPGLGVGAHLVMGGGLSLGAMLATNALASGFLTPLASLLQSALAMTRLGSYVDRIDDVLAADTEARSRAVS